MWRVHQENVCTAPGAARAGGEQTGHPPHLHHHPLCWGSCWGHRGGLRCTCKEVAVAGQELPVPTACPGSCPCPRLVLLIGSSSALLLLGKPRPFPCDLS